MRHESSSDLLLRRLVLTRRGFFRPRHQLLSGHVFASRPDWFTCIQISACIVIGSVKEEPAWNITLPSLTVFTLV